jgi:hypothetical protein
MPRNYKMQRTVNTQSLTRITTQDENVTGRKTRAAAGLKSTSRAFADFSRGTGLIRALQPQCFTFYASLKRPLPLDLNRTQTLAQHDDDALTPNCARSTLLPSNRAVVIPCVQADQSREATPTNCPTVMLLLLICCFIGVELTLSAIAQTLFAFSSNLVRCRGVGALKITRSLSGSADPSSQGAAAAPIWPSLPYRAGTRRIPVRAPT